MTVPLYPTTGYNAWILSYGREGAFPLPIIGVVPVEEYYGTGDDEQPTTTYEPVVLTVGGSVVELCELMTDSVGYIAGGALIGVVPAALDYDDAINTLSHHKVVNPDVQHQPGERIAMVDRVTAARMKAAKARAHSPAA